MFSVNTTLFVAVSISASRMIPSYCTSSSAFCRTCRSLPENSLSTPVTWNESNLLSVYYQAITTDAIKGSRVAANVHSMHPSACFSIEAVVLFLVYTRILKKNVYLTIILHENYISTLEASYALPYIQMQPFETQWRHK